MTDTRPLTPERFAAASSRLQALEQQINRAVLGQAGVIRELVVAMAAAGHVLLEGLPGVVAGKGALGA